MSEIALGRDFVKAEYDRIKTEQAQRIGFRDNMLYVQLGAVGAVASWVFTNMGGSQNAIYALLLIPWVCLILGWTYIVNDHHISKIGEYVREALWRRVQAAQFLPKLQVTGWDKVETIIETLFGWEMFHRTDERRKWRKKIQFVIDIQTFVLPGALAIGAYLFFAWNPDHWKHQILVLGKREDIMLATILAAQSISLLWLAIEFYIYTDFRLGGDDPDKYKIVP